LRRLALVLLPVPPFLTPTIRPAMKRRHFLFQSLHSALAATLLAALPARADDDDDDDDHDRARRAVEQGHALPLRVVLDQVERQFQGRAVNVELERKHGRLIYEIRLLQADGRVVKLEVDAASGAVLQVKQKSRKD
jgi:hypothetical protein